MAVISKVLKFSALFGGVLFLLFGCIPSEKVRKRRAFRKMEKALYLYSEVIQKDTLRVFDTVYFDRAIHDTVTKIIYHDSTIVINNERLKVQYYFDTITNEIFVEGECKELETVREVQVIKEAVKMSLSDEFRAVPWLLWACIIVALGGAFVFRRYRS